MRAGLAGAAAVLLVMSACVLPACGAPGGDATPGGAPRRPGYADMTPQLQAMQRDDASNPAMLWVQGGASEWAARDCGRCHGGGDAWAAMKGVAARYPAYDTASARPITLSQRINQCIATRQHQAALAPESDALLALETYVAFQSRGLPIAPPDDPRLGPWRERGARLFERRLGQLDVSCTQCHDDHAGQRLGGSTIPQAHPTGYPLYRLEWQGMGSLQRRLRGCMAGVRAEPYAYGAIEWTELELFLMQRAAGMPMDAPAVRP